MRAPEVFQRITAALDRAGIAYMLTESFASAYYGSPRTTQDIDFVLAATRRSCKPSSNCCPAMNTTCIWMRPWSSPRQQSLFNVVDMATGWKIDLIIRKSRTFSEEEFGRRQGVNLQEIALFVASAEDVIVSKLEWAKLAQSQRHIEDVAGILRMRWDSLDCAYPKKWIGDLELNTEWNEARGVAGISEP